jgi:tetratricopeptide (TPR) repeat protein
LLLALATPVLAQTSAERLREARTVRDGGDHEGALRIYKPLLDDPDPEVRAVAFEGSALILSWQGEYEEAIAYYRKVAELAPAKRRDALYGAARTLAWARRHNEGLRELQPLIDGHPEDKQIRMLEGQIAGWGGFTGRSVRAFRKVLELDPAADDARLGLAKVLAWGGRLAESQEEFEALLERAPADVVARIGIAYTLLWQGRPHHAKSHFDLITPAGRESKEYTILRVALDWALLERTDSVAHLRALMREMPGEPDVRDLWRAQSGVIGHNVRGEGTYLHDNGGLSVATAGLGGSFRLHHPAYLFGDYRKEWLEQDVVAGGFPEDEVGVEGGRVGLDAAFGHVGLRGSLGARTSTVDTGGAVFGLGARTLLRPNLGLALNLDSDFAFFTPKAVRSDVHMTTLGAGVSKALTARLGLSAGYSRTHFEGPEGGVRVTSPAVGERKAVDQNRDLLNAALRYQAGGFGGNYGNVRVDLGARSTWFRFDRQYPDVGYWNPHKFRQVMGQLGGTYRKGEELTVIASGALGVQKQDDDKWERAAYLYAEGLRQLGRRTDLWVRADYSSSGFSRRSDVGTGYRAWTVAGGVLLRVGDRSPEPAKPGVAAPPEPRPVPPLPPTPQ